jgi:hypothetical protein
MMMTHKPPCCAICGYYLTTDEQYLGHRCVDPEHWQAAGLFSPRDFYLMARLVAGAGAELAQRADDLTAPLAPIRN